MSHGLLFISVINRECNTGVYPEEVKEIDLVASTCKVLGDSGRLVVQTLGRTNGGRSIDLSIHSLMVNGSIEVQTCMHVCCISMVLTNSSITTQWN